MLTMLGIPNCDQVRKARKYLAEKGLDFVFRDIRKDPLSTAEWQLLITHDTNDLLVNTRSPSFRKTGFKAADMNPATKLEALLAQPTAMKRPLLCREGHILMAGFKPAQVDQLGESQA